MCRDSQEQDGQEGVSHTQCYRWSEEPPSCYALESSLPVRARGVPLQTKWRPVLPPAPTAPSLRLLSPPVKEGLRSMLRRRFVASTLVRYRLLSGPSWDDAVALATLRRASPRAGVIASGAWTFRGSATAFFREPSPILDRPCPLPWLPAFPPSLRRFGHGRKVSRDPSRAKRILPPEACG